MYSARIFRSRIHRVLGQKILQAASLTTTALVATATSVSITNSAASQEAPSSTGSAQTVSWQSAFWALATIAANTCLQDSGNICEIDAKFGLLIKSSPIFCAVDAFIAWGQIIYYLTRVPPREALRTVASCREQHRTNAAAESTSLPRIVGRCLLLVLTLLQALKLYALRGIPWTQVFGTMYLISYGTNALLNILGRPEPDQYHAQPERRGDILPSKRLVRFFAVVAACLQTAIWIIIVRKSVPDKWLASLRLRKCGWPIDFITFLAFLPVYLFLGILYMGAFTVDLSLLFVPPILGTGAIGSLVNGFLPSLSDSAANLFGCKVLTLHVTIVALVTAMSVTASICFFKPFPVWQAFLKPNNFPMRLIQNILDHWDKYTPFSFAFLALTFTAIISHFLYRVLCMGSLARRIGITNYGISSNLGWSCVFTFMANFALAMLYYGYVYSPQGTSMPAWLNNLPRKIV
jgi:hypothetical protein